MKALARFLLLLTIAIAVPVHGALGVTVGQCRALEHAGSASGNHEAAHGTGVVTAAGHEHAQAHPGSASSLLGDADDSSGSGSHCGPCSACCMSAAITGPAQLQLGDETFSRLDLGPDQRPIGIRLTRLDRPPLTL